MVKLTADRALDEEEIAAVLAIRAEYATLVRELLIDAADYEFEA